MKAFYKILQLNLNTYRQNPQVRLLNIVCFVILLFSIYLTYNTLGSKIISLKPNSAGFYNLVYYSTIIFYVLFSILMLLNSYLFQYIEVNNVVLMKK